MSRFWSNITKNITPYVPGEQPKNKSLIKLNTNENPYPPSPRVLEALRSYTLSDVKLYPEPESDTLREAVAEFYCISKDLVFPGNGSDEVLAFLYQAFFNRDDLIAFPDVTYSFYPVYSKLYDIPYREIPLRDDFTIDFGAYPQDLKAIIFANPNAPTGMAIPLDQIEKLLQQRPDTLIVVDEAYVDFGAETAVPLINRYDNLLVIQTLSKSRALAGMRIGLAFGCRELIMGFERIKNSFNSYTMDRLAQTAGIEAFRDKAWFDENRFKVMKTRELVKAELRAMGIPVTDSMSNFLFINIPGVKGPDALALFREEGVLVRNLKSPARIADWLRISVGTDEQMARVLEVIKKIMDRTPNQ
jgi:histidinol-phosphate aminotransferase